MIGVRAAAIRKLPHELGIPPSQLKADDFTFLTRIHYLAPSDGLWGEHESELRFDFFFNQLHIVSCVEGGTEWTCSLIHFIVDYILFCTLDVDLEVNPNEISDARYVSKAELEAMFADSGTRDFAHCSVPAEGHLANSFTPWFRLISRDLLFPWWDDMLAKSRNGGWDAESGKGVVRASVLKGDGRAGEIIKMI